ncbi:ABC transporter permease [Parabacteroides sp.]
MITSNNMKASLTDIASIILNEFKTIAGSFAIVLVLMGGIFMYGILYNYMYAPDLVRNVPVVVVDNSKTGLSREYIRLLNATPQVDVIATGEDFPQAKELLKMNEAAGILYLPADFTDRVSRGDESVFIMYETTDAFLYYLAMQEASASSMLALNADYRPSMAVFLPAGDVAQLSATQPINVAGTALYNYTKGYGTYLIPAVLIVIMFQTLLMVIGMVSGDERQNRLLRYLRPSFSQAMRLVAGKTFVYLILYAVFAFFLLGLIPFIFDLPNIGNTWNIIMLLIPFLLSASFFGLAVSIFFTDSDAPLLMIAFFSVGLIFLSGVSYPLELMPWYWKLSHYLIPAAPATLAYVKLNSMGASMSEIHIEYITLWFQCAVYFILACFAYRYNIRKSKTSNI